jgi:hypothetical protein
MPLAYLKSDVIFSMHQRCNLFVEEMFASIFAPEGQPVK